MIDYKQLRAAVDAKLSTDPEFRTIMKRITEGRATFIDTARYSQVLSHILGSEVPKAILNVDDREAVVSHLLHDSYEDINDVFGRVQKNVDKSKGLDLKPQRGEYPGERVEQFVHSLVDPTVEDSVIKRRARAGTETITKSFHDDTIKANAEFHEEAGLKCYIERIGVDCCQWCSDVAGKYEMKDQPQGIFRRHDNCDCTVIYDGQVLRGQVGNNGRRSKKWVEVPKDAGAVEPVRLNREQAQKLEQDKLVQNYKVKNDVNYAKEIDYFNVDVVPSNAEITQEIIVEELNKSEIGKETLKYLEDTEIRPVLNYEKQFHTNRGRQIGNYIEIFIDNIKSPLVAAQTVVHEITHHKFGISGCQWAEAVCMAREKMHKENRMYLTIAEKRYIVKLAKDNYSEFNWKKGGKLYGKPLQRY